MVTSASTPERAWTSSRSRFDSRSARLTSAFMCSSGTFPISRSTSSIRLRPTGKSDGPDVLLVARDYDILGGRKTNGHCPEDSLMDDLKRASTDHPIHELLARRWSPYVFADRPV